MSRLARTRRRRIIRRSALAAVLAALVAGTAGVAVWARGGPPGDAGALPAPVGALADASGSDGRGVPTAPASDAVGSRPARLGDLDRIAGRAPARISMSGIKVSGAPVVATGVDAASGALVVPANASTVVWWGAGPRPGDPSGTTVLAAHVDYNGVEGVFFSVGTLALGSRITVRTAAGASYVYAVQARRHVAKPAFAGTDVFRTDGPPRLALVTCGGPFDAATRSYLENLIVIAVPVAGPSAAAAG